MIKMSEKERKEKIEEIIRKVKVKMYAHVKGMYDYDMLVSHELDYNQWKLLLGYIEQLQNNWNELKKWLEDELEIFKSRNCYDRKNLIIAIETVLNKMQELEGNNDSKRDV